jgi:hypothetical protein
MRVFWSFVFFVAFGIVGTVRVSSQTTEFTYQGSLQNSSAPANGNFDFEFLLFDSLTGGVQQGATLARSTVAVTGGTFSVKLDFGSQFPGAQRFLEIHVRSAAVGSFIPLLPRQSISNSPYAVQSLNAATATTAANATNALIAGNVTGVVAVANGGTGSATQNFVDLSSNQNVGGTKTFTNPIVGDGSQLSNINGANIANNTITASALATNTFPNNQNLSLLGQRRWDLLEKQVTVGSTPLVDAFDGTNIWVTSFGNPIVTRLRASDGACVGTCTFVTGGLANGIVFDGANLWFSITGNNVSKLRASDGAILGTFPVGTNPQGLAFDGANIWTANNNSNNVTKIRASDGVLQGTFPVGGSPNAIEFDGTNVWVTNGSGNSVTKLRASDGSLQGTFTVGAGPNGVAFDGANIWVALGGSANVTKLRASDGACVGTCTFAVGFVPIGVAFDGANIWVVNSNSNTVTKLRASDGTLLGTFAVGTLPRGVAFDGANVWVVNANSNSVTRLPVFP